jgi:hypothetical protein
MPILEKEIQLAICDYLSLRKIFFWRQNTAPTIQNSGDKWHFRAMPKHSLKGVPDIIVIRDGTFVGLEVKRPGGKLSEQQIAFKENCEANGGKYFVVTSIDDVQKIGL